MGDYTELKRLAEAATAGPWSMCGEADGSQGFEIIQDIWNEHGTHTGKDVVVYEWSDESDPLGVIHRADAEFIAAANPVAVLALIADLDEARNGMKHSCAIRLKKRIELLETQRDQLIAENERLKTLRSTTERDLAQELEVWRHGPSCWTCGDTGDVHDMVGEWRGQCDCNAAKVIDVASERDQIKAENEALRRGIDPKWASMDQTFVIEFLRHRSVFDAENIDRMIQFAVESAQYVQLNPSKEVQP